jgi:hypothetical protein
MAGWYTDEVRWNWEFGRADSAAVCLLCGSVMGGKERCVMVVLVEENVGRVVRAVGRVPLRADRRGGVVRELESGLVGVLDGDGEIDGEELCACGAYGRVFHRLRC